jgi:hypothetical protein
MPVQALSDHAQVAYDLMIVATLENSPQATIALERQGVPVEKLFPLRRDLAIGFTAHRSGDGNGNAR